MKLHKIIFKTGLYIALLAIGFLIGIYAVISTPGDSYYVKEINSSKMYPKDSCKHQLEQIEKYKNHKDEKVRKRFKKYGQTEFEKEYLKEACGLTSHLVFSHGQWTVTVLKEKPNRTIIVYDAAGNSILFDDDKIFGKSILIGQKKRAVLFKMQDKNKDGIFEYIEYSQYRNGKYVGYVIDYNMDGQIDLRNHGKPVGISFFVKGKWRKFQYSEINGKRKSYIHYKNKRYHVDIRKFPFKLTLIDTK